MCSLLRVFSRETILMPLLLQYCLAPSQVNLLFPSLQVRRYLRPSKLWFPRPGVAMGSIRSCSNCKEAGVFWPEGTVKVTASPRVEPVVSEGPGVLEGRGLNTGVEEDEVGLDDCCGLKGLSLLKKFTIPSRKVICP